MPLTAKQLFENLTTGGFEPQRLTSGVSEIIVTAHGGRVLGVFPDIERPNLFWTPPALETSQGAAELRTSGEWQLGGERLWLAPELELHFTDPSNPCHATYNVPSAVDPGGWTIQQNGVAGLKLINNGRLLNRVTQVEFGFRIERRLNLNPPEITDSTFNSIGFELETQLLIDINAPSEAAYGLWNISMVPAGGTMLIPTRQMPELVDYFQTDVAHRCTVDSEHVSFPFSGSNWNKLGLCVKDVRGLLGYWRLLPDGQATLIVRKVNLDDTGLYMDYPGHEPARRDVVFQFYDDSGAYGGFGEFESHAPAASAANGFQAVDVHQTWCFTGARESLRGFAAELLDIDPARVE